MTDVKELIRSAKLPEKTVPLCLRADLVAEYERTERELGTELAEAGDSLAGKGEQARALEGKLAELRERMQDSMLTLTLRALPSAKYQALKDEHPPRVVDDKMDRRDAVFGFNVDTFFTALARACTIAPELDDEDWRVLLGDDEEEQERRKAKGEPLEEGKLTDVQADTLTTTAWHLNRKDVDLPF